MELREFCLREPLRAFDHLGIALARGGRGAFDESVTGDPCIVWDEEAGTYRMFYFAQRHEGRREVNCCAQALLTARDRVTEGAWEKLGPIVFEDPSMLDSAAHKPWILMDPTRPGQPVRLEGVYRLYFVDRRGVHKIIRMATSASLGGPWKIAPGTVMDVGSAGDFDAYHADTVTAYWFARQGKIVLFYKGYPSSAQPGQTLSPFGSSTAVAQMTPGASRAAKLGQILLPSNHPADWTRGWTSGLQLFAAAGGGWYGLITASPTPPADIREEPEMREPAPSLGGWAYTPLSWPVSGWKVAGGPIITLEGIPEAARQNGERVNLWRHHLLVHQNGELYLFYNAGSYGQERMFVRKATRGEEREKNDAKA